MAKQQPDHDCPGGCGARVAHHRLACNDCWWLLPLALRNAVQRGGTNRLSAVSEALQWYRQYRHLEEQDG